MYCDSSIHRKTIPLPQQAPIRPISKAKGRMPPDRAERALQERSSARPGTRLHVCVVSPHRTQSNLASSSSAQQTQRRRREVKPKRAMQYPSTSTSINNAITISHHRTSRRDPCYSTGLSELSARAPECAILGSTSFTRSCSHSYIAHFEVQLARKPARPRR